MNFLCSYSKNVKNFSSDFLIPEGKDEGRNNGIPKREIENEER